MHSVHGAMAPVNAVADALVGGASGRSAGGDLMLEMHSHSA
jgi:hypothetical protein